MMKYILLAAVFFQPAYAKCPNGCNGHGRCNLNDQCECFNEEGNGVEYLVSDASVGAVCFQHKAAPACTAEASVAGWTCKFDEKASECKRVVRDSLVPDSPRFAEWNGADCSRRTCPRSTSWSDVGANVATKSYSCSHKLEVECADQGLCDRATGLCECFPGFTGHACQRTACPDDCSGHGTCRSNRDFAYDFAVTKSHQMLQSDLSSEMFKENYVVTYDDAWDSNHLYGCLCDRGYRGSNCAMVECPSSNDPLDDKCSHLQDALTVENFQVQKFAATGSLGWREAYALSNSEEQTTGDTCNTAPNIADATGNLCRAAAPAGQTCKFTAALVDTCNTAANIADATGKKCTDAAPAGEKCKFTLAVVDTCNTAPNIADPAGIKCTDAAPAGEKCKFTAAAGANPASCVMDPSFLAPTTCVMDPSFVGPAKCVMDPAFTHAAPGDKNNHFYNGKVYACFGAMAGMDCSGRGICDYSNGQCSCFSGYSGTSCSKIEELV